ncbi:hypothetical protein CPB85DRAFT_738889 [Mucidula mucida]|nr:hypothetical protein CPB85DRAFT_738889 [Mucidula mucida]
MCPKPDFLETYINAVLHQKKIFAAMLTLNLPLRLTRRNGVFLSTGCTLLEMEGVRRRGCYVLAWSQRRHVVCRDGEAPTSNQITFLEAYSRDGNPSLSLFNLLPLPLLIHFIDCLLGYVTGNDRRYARDALLYWRWKRTNAANCGRGHASCSICRLVFNWECSLFSYAWRAVSVRCLGLCRKCAATKGAFGITYYLFAVLRAGTTVLPLLVTAHVCDSILCCRWLGICGDVYEPCNVGLFAVGFIPRLVLVILVLAFCSVDTRIRALLSPNETRVL